jgi:hypothetical protein
MGLRSFGAKSVESWKVFGFWYSDAPPPFAQNTTNFNNPVAHPDSILPGESNGICFVGQFTQFHPR